MTNTPRTELVARDTILKLLSDDEIAKVSTSETARALSEGQEYLDLEHLDRGVQHAKASSKIDMGHIIPKSSVHAETWKKIVSKLDPKSSTGCCG